MTTNFMIIGIAEVPAMVMQTFTKGIFRFWFAKNALLYLHIHQNARFCTIIYQPTSTSIKRMIGSDERACIQIRGQQRQQLEFYK